MLSTRLDESTRNRKKVHREFIAAGSKVITTATPLIEGLNHHIDIWLNETVSLIAEGLAIKALVDAIDIDKKPY